MRILALLILLAALASRADAQTYGGNIAFGGFPSTVSPPVSGTATCAIGTNVTSVSVPTNAIGTNRFSLATVHFNGDAPIIQSVSSTSGQSYTMIVKAEGESLVEVSAWGLVAPTPGTQTVTAELSQQAGAVMLCVVALETVNQLTPWRTPVTAPASGGFGPVQLTATSAIGDLVFTAFTSAQNFLTSTDDTEITYTNPGSQIVTYLGQKAGAEIVNITYELGNSNAWNALIVDIIKAP